jgi:hypothetical protein
MPGDPGTVRRQLRHGTGGNGRLVPWRECLERAAVLTSVTLRVMALMAAAGRIRVSCWAS